MQEAKVLYQSLLFNVYAKETHTGITYKTFLGEFYKKSDLKYVIAFVLLKAEEQEVPIAFGCINDHQAESLTSKM